MRGGYGIDTWGTSRTDDSLYDEAYGPRYSRRIRASRIEPVDTLSAGHGGERGTPVGPSAHFNRDGKIEVYCWCFRATVWVEPGDVREGRTRSCYRYGCHPQAMAA